jgi:hypothetical protein
MKTLWTLSLATATLAACSGGAPANRESFTAAVNDYLAQRGDLCLAKNAWPIDVTQREVDAGARNARQMPVLERVGLVVSSPANVEVDGDGEGTMKRVDVRRYALTDAGRKYYLKRVSARSGDLCAARLSLDRVTKWDLQKAVDGGAAQAVVTYTYRIAAAPWTDDAEVRRVFPVVAGVIGGAGKAELQETFTWTDAGWVAVDLRGS